MTLELPSNSQQIRAMIRYPNSATEIQQTLSAGLRSGGRGRALWVVASWILGLAPLLFLPPAAGAGASTQAGTAPPGSKLEASIPVGPLGYHPPGVLYMLSKLSFGSLDFIDSSHLLFTFHESRLLRRIDANDPTEDDQMIHAVVLGVPGGQVSASADWLMRDRDRYLWPLGDGRFLVRQRNTYFTTDSSLKLHGFIGSPTQVRATEVSPDGQILVVEEDYEKHTPEVHQKLAAEAARLGEPPPDEDIELALVNLSNRAVRVALRVELPIALPVTSSGYLNVTREKDDEFVMHFIPFQGQEVILGKVNSSCTPRERFLNANVLMIESCSPVTDDVLLDTWTIDGRRLWRGRRDGRSVWPTFATAQNGSRFAVGMLRTTHSINLADSLNDEDVKQQMVQVFDTRTGALLLTTDASPIQSAGQNFALSPDGARLAVLREGAIEVFAVPSAPPAQK